VEGVADRVGATVPAIPIIPSEIGEPSAARMLSLLEGQDMLAVCIGHVVCGVEGLIASAMLRGVMAANPCAALGALPEADREAFDSPALEAALNLFARAGGENLLPSAPMVGSEESSGLRLQEGR